MYLSLSLSIYLSLSLSIYIYIYILCVIFPKAWNAMSLVPANGGRRTGRCIHDVSACICTYYTYTHTHMCIYPNIVCI